MQQKKTTLVQSYDTRSANKTGLFYNAAEPT